MVGIQRSGCSIAALALSGIMRDKRFSCSFMVVVDLQLLNFELAANMRCMQGADRIQVSKR
jgi:hypothetical protein